MIARALLRRQDRLIACELEPKAAAALGRNLRDPRVKALRIDGWTALAAYLPPKERRGLVLIDPPYEQDSDFGRLPSALAEAQRKWATGIYLLWYPIKTRGEPDSARPPIAPARPVENPALRTDRCTDGQSGPPQRLAASLWSIRPGRLDQELAVLLPALAQALGRDGAGRFRLDWLAGAPPG